MFEDFERAMEAIAAGQRQIIQRLERIEKGLNSPLAPAVAHQGKSVGQVTASPTDARKLLYARKEAAAALGISVRTLDHMIAQKIIATRRLGKKVMVTAAELRRIAGQNTYSLSALTAQGVNDEAQTR
jgi:hypothetical protein